MDRIPGVTPIPMQEVRKLGFQILSPNFQILGSLEDEIVFTPLKSGNYIAKVEENGIILNSYSFDILSGESLTVLIFLCSTMQRSLFE